MKYGPIRTLQKAFDDCRTYKGSCCTPTLPHHKLDTPFPCHIYLSAQPTTVSFTSYYTVFPLPTSDVREVKLLPMKYPIVNSLEVFSVLGQYSMHVLRWALWGEPLRWLQAKRWFKLSMSECTVLVLPCCTQGNLEIIQTNYYYFLMMGIAQGWASCWSN